MVEAVAEGIVVGRFPQTDAGVVATPRTQQFASIYRDTVADVHRYLSRHCAGSRSEAEDLTQETFLVAMRVHASGGEVTPAWLIGVARNKLLEHARRQEREERRLRRHFALTGSGRERLVPEPEPHDRVHVALRSLPPVQRLVLTLRYVDDMSVPEVADAIGKSVRAAESLLARGREALRRRIGEISD